MYTVLKHAKISFISLVNENLTDSVPTKMFESLGVGCPVLLAASGEAAEILEETGLGIAVKPNDDDILWSAFTEMYEKNDVYKQRGPGAKEVIHKKYSRQVAAKIICDEIERRFDIDSGA